MKTHRPEILTDGGPWAEHDIACPVCWNYTDHGAVLDIGTAIGSPCDSCRAQGWEIHKRRFGQGRFPGKGFSQ